MRSRQSTIVSLCHLTKATNARRKSYVRALVGAILSHKPSLIRLSVVLRLRHMRQRSCPYWPEIWRRVSGSTQLENEAQFYRHFGKDVGRLSMHLRSKWAEKASQLYRIMPNFSQLVDFIQARATVANTYFGEIISSKAEANGRERRRFHVSNKNHTSMATFGEGKKGIPNERHRCAFIVAVPTTLNVATSLEHKISKNVVS